jgi:hypothetical protein
MTELESGCLRACERCAQLCEERIRSDPSFRGQSQYSGDQLAMISCGEVCRVAASSIPDGDEWIDGVCNWCADVCLDFAARPRRLDSWTEVQAAAREAASLCRDLASALRRQRESAA